MGDRPSALGNPDSALQHGRMATPHVSPTGEAEALPVRDIPLETMQAWVTEDERDAESFWQRAGKV